MTLISQGTNLEHQSESETTKFLPYLEISIVKMFHCREGFSKHPPKQGERMQDKLWNLLLKSANSHHILLQKQNLQIGKVCSSPTRGRDQVINGVRDSIYHAPDELSVPVL